MLRLGLNNRFRRARGRLREAIQNRLLRPRLYRLDSPERIGSVYRRPTDLCAADRVMIYALVRGLRPTRCLEIGTRWGGSARIITNALEDNGEGRLVGGG